MSPHVTIDGSDEAMNQVGAAMALYRQFELSGKARQALMLDVCAVVFERGKIAIVALVSEYALFLWNPATSTFFNLFPDVVPGAWPTFSALLPAMATFYPVYPDELMVPSYDRIKTCVAGSATAYQELLFATPILSSHSEALAWQGLLMQPNLDTENQMILTRYQLTGYLNHYDQPTYSKIVLANDAANLFEADFSALNVFPASGFTRSGVAYRRLIDADAERMIVCIQDDSTHSGQVYEVVEDSGALALSPFGLADLPAGDRLATGLGPGYADMGTYGRHIDQTYDVFTSERSLHYYVVKFVSDSAVAYNVSGPAYVYPNDIQLFPGMLLVVEKRLKTDLSLVTTYSLTPSAVDWTLQGMTYAQVVLNMANAQANGYTTGTDILTRFVPFGTGHVLVDADGVEYPVLPVLACTQDWLWDPTMNELGRTNYTGGIATSMTLRRNVMQQSALLWLGTPPGGFDGWTWDGVDAAGLKISEAQEGQMNDTSLGMMRTWGSIIGDSAHILAQLQPFTGTDAGQSNNQRIISVRVDAGLPVVRLELVQDISQAIYMFDI